MEDGEGLFLREAPSEILRDREVVMAAVKQNGRALEFADETLQEDKECLGKKKSSLIFLILWTKEPDFLIYFVPPSC